MLLRAYYHLKPIIPRRAQLAVRRAIVRRRMAKYSDVWPIDPKGGAAPPGWPGWPEGKRFALVLTHDVESRRGLDRCLALAEIDERLGFRSSFNFLADEYQVAPRLRQELSDRGFEVGLHGLTHDGLLYQSREHFMTQAARINNFIKEWRSAGFRSPAMHRNFGWLGELDIEYDSSSFDTDPFEPYPEGTRTIFPFHVGPPTTRKRYVELPYTLPQDFTLFVVLQERGIDIWRRKLDWIAERGGMAMLIAHPDYMTFPKAAPREEEYPSALYEEFLRYARERYAGVYWQALPKDVARFWNSVPHTEALSQSLEASSRRSGHGEDTKHFFASLWIRGESGEDRALEMRETKPSESRTGKRKRVLMIVENSYPLDIRVRREADVLKQRFDVTVISIKMPGQRFHEMVDGVEVFRLPRIESGDDRIKTGFFASLANKVGYILQYLYFTTAAALIFLATLPARWYRVIHVHNPPDTLFLVGLLGKLFGIRFVYDHHDLSPELYLTKYGGRRDCIHRVMLLCEKASCKLADVVISTNESYRAIELGRHGIDRAKTYVVRNDPDAEEFRPGAEGGSGSAGAAKVLFYLGSINPQDGVDVLLRALAHLRGSLKREDFTCRIVGSGDSLKAAREYADELGLSDKVAFLGLIKERELLKKHLGEADICMEPAPENELNRHSTFIKVLEYMSAGKPIVAFDLKETRFSAGDAAILVPPGEVAAYAQAIAGLMEDSAARKTLGSRGRARVEAEFNWTRSGSVLNSAYDALVS